MLFDQSLMNRFHPTRSALGRRVSFALAACTFLTTVATAIITDLAERRHDRERFEALALANRAFVENSLLPPSQSLARKLSGVLGLDIGFRLPGGTLVLGNGDAVSWNALLQKLPAGENQFCRAAGRELRCLRLRSGVEMLFARPGPGWSAIWTPSLLASLLILPTLALLPALALARDLVIPLHRLSAWLPHLGHDAIDGPDAPVPLPPATSTRSDEIGDLARALFQARERLTEQVQLRRQSERMATFGRMATSLAHEIKNPAAAIRLHTDLLSEPGAPGFDPSSSLNAIRTSTDRIVALVHQWPFVVRPSPPHRSPHDLCEIVSACLRDLRSSAAHHGITFNERDRPSGPVPLIVDWLRIEHALRNILANASEAMPLGGEVQISWIDQPGIALTILDSGPGFSLEALQNLGKPFFSTKEGGLGLGLNLATEVLQAHGASLSVSRNPSGTGAAVTLTFPRSLRP
jgi:signal transduction histidine kinase